jgi:hypothetical protein
MRCPDARRDAVNEWYDRTLYSRLDSKRDDVILLIMQRLHVEDLAGYVLAKEPWIHFNLPAIAEVEHRIPIGPNQFHFRRGCRSFDQPCSSATRLQKRVSRLFAWLFCERVNPSLKSITNLSKRF